MTGVAGVVGVGARHALPLRTGLSAFLKFFKFFKFLRFLKFLLEDFEEFEEFKELTDFEEVEDSTIVICRRRPMRWACKSRRDDTLLTGGFNRRKSGCVGGAQSVKQVSSLRDWRCGVMARNEAIQNNHNILDCFTAFAMTLSLRDCAPLIFCVHLSIFDF
jgi:hypothetical protein